MGLIRGVKYFFANAYVKKTVVFLVVTALCGTTAMVIIDTKPTDKSTAQESHEVLRATGMPVSVRVVEPGSYPAVIKALGEVMPLWQTTVRARAEGKIVMISKQLRVGSIVKKGELLVRIEKSAYEMAVADAASRLAVAKIDLLREERESMEARKNWKQSGISGEPTSSLVLRKPQLKAAQSDVAAARATLKHAKILLGHTEIRAPYDGVIMQQNVNPGESLFIGDKVVTLYGLETAEIGVHLDAGQWALLPQSVFEAEVRLVDPQQQAGWEARVVRESLHLSRDSRLRTLFMQVENPLDQTPPLLPGTFVRAEISGKQIPDLLRITEAAMTKQGIVWFVDKDNLLVPHNAEPVFYGKAAYISVPLKT